MRFFENGPSIPTTLLDECADGKVVFFCGAGVSQYDKDSGIRMPGFVELAKEVISQVKPKEDSDIAKAISEWEEDKQGSVSLDQIFYLLQQNFGEEAIADIVATELNCSSPLQTFPCRHKDILKLSKNGEGIPQVITTNFDILFEMAQDEKNIRINFPPFLPDLSSQAQITGITYIHGRINQPSKHLPKKMIVPNKLILSKSNFGRAYLSEGWAAGLVRHLISNYTVVFIGYRAEDPPIQYMLLGMEKHLMKSKLYAFERKTTDSRKAEWKERGVTLITYSDHADLWETISEWANKKENLSKWRAAKLAVTQKDPKTVKPYERGQAAYLLTTVEGIKDLRNMSPSARSEWINVFDATVRKDKDLAKYVIDESGTREESPYLLDDDLGDHSRGDDESTTIDLLRDRDSRGIYYESLEESKAVELIKWICDNANSPAMAWWFSRRHRLHRSILESMERRLHTISKLNWRGRLAWKLILDSHAERSISDPWKRFESALGKKRNKWDKSALREFSNVTTPYIVRKDKDGTFDTFPPEEDWKKVNIQRIVNLSVEFPKISIDKVTTPTRSKAHEAIMIFQKNLLHASFMISEIDRLYGSITYTASCDCSKEDPDEIRNIQFYHEISWFISIFEKFVKFHPESSKAVAKEWPVSDRYFFRKIKLYCLKYSKIFSESDVYNEIMELNDEQFWCDGSARELLFLIRDRWSKFSGAEKNGVIDRIMDGHEKNAGTTLRAARYGRWLQLNGCEISKEHAECLEGITNSIDKWKDSWAESVTDTIVRSLKLEDSYQRTSKDVDVYNQQKHDCTNIEAELNDHFDSSEGKRSPLLESGEVRNYTPEQWNYMIKNSKDVSDPEYRDLMVHLATFPHKVFRHIKFNLSDHIGHNFQRMISLNSNLAWKIIDRFISSRRSLVSFLNGTASYELRDEERSSDVSCYSHATSSPVGKVTHGLIGCVDVTTPEISLEVKLRLERLLSETTAGRSQCVSILTSNIGFLSHVDQDWVKENLIPLFDFRSELAEAAWSGLLYYPRLLDRDLFLSLSHLVTNLYPWVNRFSWKGNELKRCAFLVITAGTIFAQDLDLSYRGSVKECLKKMDMVSVKYSIFWLQDIGKKSEDGWSKFVIPFLESTWPRQEAFKSPELVWSWMQLLLNSGDEFPEVYSSVKNFLVPIANHSILLKHFLTRRLGQEPLASKFPAAVLSFIDTVVPNDPNFFIAHLYRVLSMIGSANDELLQDVRYIRLMNIATRRPLTNLS